MLVYVSGPISAPTPELVKVNVQKAAAVAAQWMKAGHAVICPHTNSCGIEEFGHKFSHAEWMKADIKIIARCDSVVMLHGWENSKGATEERAYAEKLGIPVCEPDEIWPLHTTELRCPEQCKAFAETLGVMYRTHLKKNADYSPANIMGTGFIGTVTRLWDKMARLMSLCGFNLVISEPATYTEPRQAANESIEDTFIDLSNYGVIAYLLRMGKWGR